MTKGRMLVFSPLKPTGENSSPHWRFGFQRDFAVFDDLKLPQFIGKTLVGYI